MRNCVAKADIAYLAPEFLLLFPGRQEQRELAAYLRYLVPRQQANGGVQEVPGRGSKARSPQDWQGPLHVTAFAMKRC